MTKDEHISELQRLAAEAQEAGDYGAAVEATYAIGKVLGFYRERVVIEYNGATPDAVTRAVIELLSRKAAVDGPGPHLDS